MTSRIGMLSTSTWYIDFSTVSGSMPWLIVRFPWGSMSTASTRWPASANATARLRVVVVFATPPFWLAKAITFARPVPGPVCGVVGPEPVSGVRPLPFTPSPPSVAEGSREGATGAVTGGAAACGRGPGSASLCSSSWSRPMRYSGRANRWSKPIVRGYSHQGCSFLPAVHRATGGSALTCAPLGKASLMEILDKRLIFVTGKGGVGKSTVAAALGVAASRQGKRTIVCEVAQQERMSYVFHREGVGYRETEIGEGLYAFSIDPQRALEEYLQQQIRIKPVYDLMFKNRIFTYFAAATPGLRELVTIGKVWELAQLDRRVKKGATYDTVIVDAPATGHGIGFLRTPKTFGDIARVGPVKRQADAIHKFITDPALTSVVAVAWPEEMPVNETVDLQRSLQAELGLPLDRIFMNGLYPHLFTDDEAAVLRERADDDAGGNGSDPLATARRAALRAAVSEHRRANAQQAQLERLETESGQHPVELPFLFRPQLDMDAVEDLADTIEDQLASAGNGSRA